MHSKTRGTWEMVAAMAISGTIGWLVVSSGQRIVDLLFWRCLLGALTLLAFCAALGLLKRLPWRLAGIAAIGGVAIVCNWLLLFAAYSHAPISIATVVYNTQPFMLVGLSALLLRERFSAASIAWLLLAFGGVLLVAQAKSSHAPEGANYAWGIALALGAAFLYAIAALVAKRLKGTAPHVIALIQMVVGTAMLTPWALQAGLPTEPQAWAAFGAIGVIYTGVMYILLYGALQKLPTALAGTLSFIYPLVALVVDHVAFGVRLGPAQWAGAAAILVAVAGINILGPRAAPRPLQAKSAT